MPTIFQRALDWLGWEQLTETRSRHQQIMSALKDLNTRLTGVETALNKASGEITGELAKLREQLANTELPADAAETLTRLESAARGLDDIIPDAPPAEPDPAPAAN